MNKHKHLEPRGAAIWIWPGLLGVSNK